MARTLPGVAVEAHSGKAVSCTDAADEEDGALAYVQHLVISLILHPSYIIKLLLPLSPV